MSEDRRPGRAQIRDATLLLLLQAVPEAGRRIYTARTWPLESPKNPCLLVYTWRETKTLLSTAGSAPQFQVDAKLVVRARAEAEDEIGLEAALDALAGAVENALLTDPDWVARFERIGGIESSIHTLEEPAERPVGEVALVFDVRWTEDFPPRLPFALAQVALRVDGAEPFDRTGTWPAAPPFPAAPPAPRTSGPDGRAEVAATINLPVE